MKTSTEINSIAGAVGMEKAVELVAKAGFDCWDFSMFAMGSYDWSTGKRRITGHPLETRDSALKLAEKLRKIGLENGIYCNQSHAPFPVVSDEMKALLPVAIECTAEAGGKICVIHPDNNKNALENAEMFRGLLPVAKKFGVIIATENMWNWNGAEDHAAPAACSDGKSFREHVDALDDPFMAACVDVGHAEMKGLGTDAATMIRELGPRVVALHLHDNDKWHDSHGLPFTMNIDFGPVVAALREIGYRGEFTLESSLAAAKAETPEEGVKVMYRATRKLVELYESI